MHTGSLMFGVIFGSLVSVSAVALGAAVPKTVQRAVDQIFGAAKTEIEHEREDGVDRYEVGTSTELSVVIDAQGVVETIEVAIPLGLVPKVVSEAARGALPRGYAVKEAELLVRGSKVLYELEARIAGASIELVLDAGGSLVSQRAEQDEGAAEAD